MKGAGVAEVAAGRDWLVRSYSLMWPTRSLVAGEELSRNFLAGIGEEKQRSVRLSAWFHTPSDFFRQVGGAGCARVGVPKLRGPPVHVPRGRRTRSTGRRCQLYRRLSQVQVAARQWLWPRAVAGSCECSLTCHPCATSSPPPIL